VTSDPYSPINSFAAQQHILLEQLYFHLEQLPPVLRSDVMRVLEGEGKLLAQRDINVQSSFPSGVWPLLTLLIVQHISPDIDLERASSVALAVEYFVCALDLLDDIEDDDQTLIIQALGASRVLNVSTTLLMMAQRSLLSLSGKDVPPELILRLLETLQESALAATAGQHQDLLAEQRSAQDFTREECIEIATAKAGSIMRLACRLGAIYAGADDTVREQFSDMGELLGIAHQLDNDSHDLYYLLQDETSTIVPGEMANTRRSVKTDLVRGKKTLPVVLAAKKHPPLKRMSEISDEENRQYLQALHEGIITTWGICLLYRERARDRLQEIEAQKPVASELRLLLGFS
jgi:geranylgeranyl pyrophosphate synthase